MTSFTIDTSGSVGPMPGGSTPVPTCNRFLRWDDLSPFTQGYVEAMFATTQLVRNGCQPDQWRPGFSDLAPETLARIIADCEAFASRWAPADHSSGAQRRNGALFWSHRVAEWDAFPPLTVTLGDDGKVRFA